MKLRSYLLLVALVAGIPGLLITALFMWWSATAQRTSIERGVVQLANNISAAVDQEISRARAIAETIAASPAIDLGRFERVHSQAVRVSSSSGWIVLTKGDGEQVLNALVPYGKAIPRAAATELIRTVHESGKAQTSNLLIGAVANRPIVSVGVPVIRNEQILYVVVFAFEADTFKKLLDARELPAGWVASIIDRDGITIARNIDNQHWMGKPAGETLRPLLAQVGEGAGTGRSRDGIPVLFTWTTSAVSGWRVAVGAPSELLNAPLRGMYFLFSIAALFLALGIAAALGIGHRMNRRITAAANQLSQAAIALGQHTPPAINDRSRITEINIVSASLRWADEALRKRSDEQERARREAVAANQAKDEFIATLAHEVRSPLAAIAATNEVIERSPGGVKHETAIIRRQVTHLTALLDELFDAGRVATNKLIVVRRPMNLTEAVRSAMETLSYDKDRLRVTLDAPEDVWIEGDETRIQQVISNLLTNAVKFTPERGSVEVSVSRMDNWAIAKVCDTGIGISRELLPHVFDLFVQGEHIDGGPRGMGIGLALVQRIMELHGGTVTAASEGRGKGSCFTIRLPSIGSPTG